jgi:hypothetical protein
MTDGTGFLGDISRWRMKLHELKMRKRELASCQAKVEEDIQAMKQATQLIAVSRIVIMGSN